MLQEEQDELLGAIAGEDPDMGLSYVGMEPTQSHNHMASAELDQRDILYGSAFTPGGSSETHGSFWSVLCQCRAAYHSLTISETLGSTLPISNG